MREYVQGKYTPRNPTKYVGKVDAIYYRSSWELKFLKEIDLNPNVLYYSSEELIIPYLNPVDNKVHRYFPDFVIKIKGIDGKIKVLVIEIKPKAQTIMPVRGKKRMKTFITEAVTWTTNQAKWQAAKEYCSKNGMEFLIMTEKELGIVS